MKPQSASKRGRPLDREALQRLALYYVGRYATTRAKLRSYLNRKVADRGWQGPDEPQVDGLIDRLTGLGYVDDAAFAAARASTLQQRGYGERRVAQALAAAGIDRDEAEAARERLRPGALDAALRFARRKGIGPFASAPADRAAREKAFAAMLRAGHPMELVKRVLDSRPGEVPECDDW